MLKNSTDNSKVSQPRQPSTVVQNLVSFPSPRWRLVHFPKISHPADYSHYEVASESLLFFLKDGTIEPRKCAGTLSAALTDCLCYCEMNLKSLLSNIRIKFGYLIERW